jgi:signal transduction histidine kinase
VRDGFEAISVKGAGGEGKIMANFDIPWQTLIDTAPDGLFILDAGNTVQYANAAALALLGLPAPEGVPVAEWLADLGDLSSRLLLKAIEEKSHYRIHLPDADKHLLFEAEPLVGGDGTLCRVRRDYEVEAAEVIASMVHELRLPMTSIMGYAKMMMTVGAESLSDVQRQFLDTIDRNVKRLDRDLLAVQDMARVDRARVKLAPAPQFPANVAAQVLEELQSLIEEKGHRVTLDLPDDLPAVYADAERFKQILHILLDNALKYTPKGGQISLRGQAADGLLQIDVVDNGPGIPGAEQEKIFQKFFRGEDERIRDYPGLGLNLYIARGLAELQGGRLWFESTEGQGSTFSLILPVWQK